MQRIILNSLIIVLIISLPVSVNAALELRGNGLVYDNDINITWLLNANLADTNTFGVGGINANGTMSWDTAFDWISAMNTNIYLGISTWRLPVCPGGDSSFTCNGEMKHLVNVEGISSFSQTPFQNVQPDAYWLGNDNPNFPADAWVTLMANGVEGFGVKSSATRYAMAVANGDLGPVVPEPISSILFVTGGTLLAGRRYLKKRRTT